MLRRTIARLIAGGDIFSRMEARTIVRDGCDHPLVTETGRRLYLGGWCKACDEQVRTVLGDDDPIWTSDE